MGLGNCLVKDFLYLMLRRINPFKVRNMENLPVMLKETAEEIGQVERGVIGDDFRVAYLVINGNESGPGIIGWADFSLGENAIFINDRDCIKSYQHGEESSIYDKKCGDTVFDAQGKELGVLSDFVIDLDEKRIRGVEVSAGVFKDMLAGRSELPLESVYWVSRNNVVVGQEGSDD